MMLALSKLTTKAQTTIPKDVRKALDLKAGDSIAYDIQGNQVILRKADAYREGYYDMLNRMFEDWGSPEDAEAYDGLLDENDRRSLSVVIVPFPFTDLPIWKPRPAVVLSKHPFQEQTGRTVLAMITRGVRTAWLSDVPISELEPAGLPKPSLVRARIGTVENRFIARQIGILSEADRAAVVSAFREIIVSF